MAELKIVYWKKERENRVTFVIPFGAEYTAGTRYVRWKTENLLLGKITGRYRLDRRTVKLWRSGKTFQCHLSSESKIRSKLKAVIARAKRKNKL